MKKLLFIFLVVLGITSTAFAGNIPIQVKEEIKEPTETLVIKVTDIENYQKYKAIEIVKPDGSKAVVNFIGFSFIENVVLFIGLLMLIYWLIVIVYNMFRSEY